MFSLQLTDCSCCGFYLMTKYKRLVTKIYPQHSAAEGLQTNDLSKLAFFVQTQPEKLDRVFVFLSQKTRRYLKRRRDWPYVILSLQAMTELMKNVPDSQVILFVDPYLRTIESVFSVCSVRGSTDFDVLNSAIGSLNMFCDILEQNIQYNRDYGKLLSCLCSLCMTPIPKTEDYHRLRLIGLRGLKSLERKLRADSENSLMVSGMHKDATSKILVPVLTPLKDSSDWIDESRDLLCNIFEHCISLAHFRDLSLSASHFIAKNLSGGSVECEQNARKLIEVMMESASQSCAGSFAATMLTSALVSQLDLLNDLKSILVIFSLIEHLIAHTNLMRLEIILDLDHLLQHIVRINVKFMDRGEPADTATRTIINTLTTFCTNQCFLNQTLQCFVHIASVRQISALVRPSLVAISEYFCRSIDLEFRPDKHSVCSLVELSSEDARLSSLCFDILTSLVDQHRLTDLAYTRIRSGNHRDCLPGPISKTILELMDDQFSFDQCWTFVLDTIRNQSILIVKSKDLCKLLCAFLYEFVFFRPKISGPRSAELSLFQYPYIKKTISDVVEIVSKYNDTRLFIYTFIDSLTKGIDAINSSASVIVERVLKWTGFNRSLDSESPAGFLSPQRSRKAATDATHPESSIKHGALKLIMSGKRSEEKRKVNLFDDMANVTFDSLTDILAKNVDSFVVERCEGETYAF